MESNAEESTELHLQTTRDDSRKSQQNNDLETILAELTKTKEEINKARDSAVQSWLDSKPLIDRLEKRQLDLTNTKNRASMATVTISELESQLKTTNASITIKKEEELNTKQTIEELQRAMEQNHAEMERLKFETDHERRARGRMKQELRLRRQTLRTLQLTLRAVRIESEAIGASTAAALHYIEVSNTEHENVVQLPYDEYDALARRANEEITLAEWRVSVSMEQRQMAEKRRDEALRRLKERYAQNKSRKRGSEENAVTEKKEQDHIKEANNDEHTTRKHAHVNKARTAPQANLDSAHDRGHSQKLSKRPSINQKSQMVKKKKKSSILHQIKSFFVRNITQIFG